MSDTKRPKAARSLGAPAGARMVAAVPYFAKKTPHTEIAKRFGVSRRTVTRWAVDPRVIRRLDEIAASRVAEVRSAESDIVRESFAALSRVLTSSNDDRTVVEAAKTVLDRFGHPAVTKAEQKIDAPAGPQLVLQITNDDARSLARGDTYESQE